MANAVAGSVRIDLTMNAAAFEKDAGRARNAMEGLGRAISDVSAKIDRASIFFNSGMMAAERFVSASQGILNISSTFEKGMSNVGTLIDSAAENLGAMSEKVLEIGRRTPVALAELTSGLYDIRSAGIPAADAMAVLEGSARLAVAGLGTTKEAVDLITSSINAFGLEGEEADRVYDTVFKTVKAGKTTISQLAQGFGAVAGTVATAGVKIDEYLASVAALTTTGLPAAQAHTQLRAAIAGMTRESEIGKKVLDTLGAKTFKDLIEQSGGLVGAFQKIVATLQGNDANLIKLLGSVEAYNAVIGLTGKQNEAFTSTLDDMRVGVEQIGIAYEKQNQTIFAATQKLQNNFQEFGIAIGNALAPAIKSVSQFVEELTADFKGLSPEMQETIAQIAAFAAITGPAIVAAGFFVNALASLIPVLKSTTLLIAGLVVAGGPISLFIALAATASTAWLAFRDDYERVWKDVDLITTSGVSKAILSLRAMHLLVSELASGSNPLTKMPISAASEGFGDYTRAVNDLGDAFANVELQAWEANTVIATLGETQTNNVPITNLATEATNRRSDAQRILNQLMREGKQVTEELATPEEALLARQQKLSTLLMANAISAETYGRAMEKATFVSLNAYAGMASDIAGSLSQVFGESKGFAIAQAIINTAEGVTKALAAYPPPFNFAAAAAVGAAGAAQIAAIRSTNKGGGGGGGGQSAVTPNTGGGAGTTPQAVTVNLHGQTFGREHVFGLIDQINEAARDGKHVIVRAA